MNIPLFIGLIAFLGGASFWLGKKGLGKSKSSDDFFLMGRKLGLFGLMMTLLATQIGGGALLGASEEAYIRGWSVLFYPLGMVLGMGVLGLGYGAKMRKLNLTTVPEIFETIYQSVSLRKIASLLSIASLFLILVGQAIAARKFFISLGFHGDLLFVLFWSLLIAYTAMGGLGVVVKTDMLQAGFILIALIMAIFVALQADLPLTPATEVFSPDSVTTPWLTWLLMPLLFMLIEQDMGQRCFAAKNPRTVTIAALLAALILLIVAAIPIFFGAMAAHLGLEVEKGSSVFIASVQALTNPTVSTCVICAILMAISSTADSLLCSVSSNISCDFPKFGKSVASSQYVTLAVGGLTLLLAFAFDHVVAMLMFSYELAVSSLFVPVTMAVWTRAPHKRSAILSMGCGGVSFVLLLFVKIPFPKELISLGCSLGAFAISELDYKIKNKESLPSL